MATLFVLFLLGLLLMPMVVFFYCRKTFSKLEADPDKANEHRSNAITYAGLSLASTLALVASAIFLTNRALLWLAIVAVVVLLTVSSTQALKYMRLAGLTNTSMKWTATTSMMAGYFAFLAALARGVTDLLGGLAWGRPLRVNGKIVHPELVPGEAWALGGSPDVTPLDGATRRSLEALWLHDARKEYASVPAFSRIGWQMAALAAPPELLRDIHIAAIQEIDHARRCFALAAGFGEHAWTVAPIPAMLKDHGAIEGNPYVALAVESLGDGCLLEGFNADIAENSVPICRDASSLQVVRLIAREERAHAELSWRIVEFCLLRDPKAVAAALELEMDRLAGSRRPTASSSENLPLLRAANQELLVQFGRLPDEHFDALWAPRIAQTRARLSALLANATSPIAA